jgi:hypothetical protein
VVDENLLIGISQIFSLLLGTGSHFFGHDLVEHFWQIVLKPAENELMLFSYSIDLFQG